MFCLGFAFNFFISFFGEVTRVKDRCGRTGKRVKLGYMT